MNKKAKPFHLVMIVVFVVITVAAVFVFSTSDNSGGGDDVDGVVYGPVSVWGTFQLGLEGLTVFSGFNDKYKGSISATYTYIPPEKLDQELLEALANGTNPDVLLLPNAWLHRNALRIQPISYDTKTGGISVREFRDTFAQGGELFLSPEGVMAVPLVIDPLVMYWNRDLFTNASLASPPKLWKEFLSIAPKLTKRDDLNIAQSAVAMGEFENVKSAKDILALLFLQVGNPITMFVDVEGATRSTLIDEEGISEALRFYTDFVNPRKAIYTWNRSLPNSQDAFLANDLGIYFDVGSAYTAIVAKNPRLNFDIASVPQTDGQVVETTFGNIHGLAVLKKARNIPGGLAFAKLFSAAEFAAPFADATRTAPMRRDVLALPQTDPAKAVLYDAALKGRSWRDPNPSVTDTIFARMVDDVTSGKLKVSEAITGAGLAIDAYFKTK